MVNLYLPSLFQLRLMLVHPHATTQVEVRLLQVLLVPQHRLRPQLAYMNHLWLNPLLQPSQMTASMLSLYLHLLLLLTKSLRVSG